MTPEEMSRTIAALARAHAEGKAEGLEAAAREVDKVADDCSVRFLATRIRSLIPAAPGGGGK